MKAFTLLHLCSDMLFGKRSKPVFYIALIAYLCTKSEVAISTLKEEYLLRDVDATFRCILNVQQRLEHSRLVFIAFAGCHLLHVNRDERSTFLWNGIEIVSARA